MRKILVLLLCLGLVGCATVPKPITNSFGNPDLAKYKTFTVANTSLPNTPQFLRDYPILQNVVFRLQEEGFEFVDSIEKADFVATVSFLDKVGQRYIPPRSYTTISYDSGSSTTNISGTATAIGSFLNFQGTANTSSSGTATATTFTTGGYYVSTYGVSVAINVYDTKSQQLVWYGAGATGANISFIDPAIDNIILSIIDAQLITPAYIKGNRKEIRERQGKEMRENEYLKPIATLDKIGFYQKDYKDEIDGIDILCSLSIDKRGWFVLWLGLKNNTEKVFDFKFSDLKVVYKGKNLYLPTKSEVASAFFKAGDILFKNRDEAVRSVYEHYLESHKIIPNEHYMGSLYAIIPLWFSPNSKISVAVPLQNKNIELDFIYQKGWMTIKQFK